MIHLAHFFKPRIIDLAITFHFDSDNFTLFPQYIVHFFITLTPIEHFVITDKSIADNVRPYC